MLVSKAIMEETGCSQEEALRLMQLGAVWWCLVPPVPHASRTKHMSEAKIMDMMSRQAQASAARAKATSTNEMS